MLAGGTAINIGLAFACIFRGMIAPLPLLLLEYIPLAILGLKIRKLP